MNIGNYITIAAYLVTIGISWGVVTSKINQLTRDFTVMKEDTKTALSAMKAQNELAMANLEKTEDLHMESLRDLTAQRFNVLEQKQDKHNNLIERMTIVEQSTKSAHKRLDGLCDEVHVQHRRASEE